MTWTMWALRDTWSHDHNLGGDALKSSHSADSGSPTLEHITVRGESPNSLEFFSYMDHVGPKGHMVT